MNSIALLMLPLALLPLCGCADQAARAPLEVARPPPDTNVYFYPAAGNAPSAEQQDRDRYECNEWAVQQTGFDPSKPNLPPHHQMRIVSGGPPSGAGAAAGAVTGAVLGAAVARPADSGKGALLGLLFGAAIGEASESERYDHAQLLRAQSDANFNQVRNAQLEQKAAQFRRAISACLSARGYSVK